MMANSIPYTNKRGINITTNEITLRTWVLYKVNIYNKTGQKKSHTRTGNT